MGQRPVEHRPVASLEPREGLLQTVIDAPVGPLLRRRHPCGEHRRQRQGHEQRDHYGTRDGQSELLEEVPDDPAHRCHGDKDSHNREGGSGSRERDLSRAAGCSLEGSFAALPATLDVLEYDNGIVDDDSDGQRHGQQCHHVKREPEDRDHSERGDERERDRESHDECRPRAAQEAEHRQSRQQGSERQRELRLGDRFTDRHREVDEALFLREGEACRHGLLDARQTLTCLVGNRHCVCARLLEQPDTDGRVPVVTREHPWILGAVLDSGDVLQVDGRAIGVDNHEPLELFNRLELRVGLDGVLDHAALHAAARDVDVLAADRAQHIGGGEPSGVKLLAVEPDPDVPLPSSEDLDRPDA